MAGYNSPSDQHSSPSSQWQSSGQPSLPDRPLYEDGLEVVPSTAPEWTSSSGQESSLGHKIVLEPERDVGLYKKYDDAGLEAVEGTTTPPRPWYKRKLMLGIVVAAVIILAIGLGVGLGVGLTAGGGGNSSNESGDNDSSSSDNNGGSGNGNNNNDTNSPCKGGFCSRLLSVNLYDENDLYVFARSASKDTISYIRFDGSNWNDWTDLDTPPSSSLASPPSSQAWVVNATYERIDLFTVGNEDSGPNKVYYTWLSEKEDFPPWEEIGENLGSPIVTCSVHIQGQKDRLDLWAIDGTTGNITKTWWTQYADEDIAEEGYEGVTEEIGEFNAQGEWLQQDVLGKSRSPPAVNCPKVQDSSERYHDIIWYDESRANAWHSSFSDETNWSNPVDFEGPWIGDPILYWGNEARTDGFFFGVKENHELFHLSWDADGEFSDMESLGGDIHSAVWMEPDGDVVDIVALSGKGTLVHKHKDRSGWEDDWEDLEIEAASTPYLRTVHDTMWLLALNDKGELMAWSRNVDSGESQWKDSLGQGRNLGGNLTLEYW